MLELILDLSYVYQCLGNEMPFDLIPLFFRIVDLVFEFCVCLLRGL